MSYVPAISWTWTPGFRVPRQAALWSHDLKSLQSEQARFPRGLLNLLQYHGEHICLGHFVFRTWFTWRLEWLLVFMSSAKAPFWQTIWSTHGHQERKAMLFWQQTSSLIGFRLLHQFFSHYSPALTLDLCTGQELGWEVHSMKGHRSHFYIKYSTRGGVLLHPLHSTLALLSNCSMVIMLWFQF